MTRKEKSVIITPLFKNHKIRHADKKIRRMQTKNKDKTMKLKNLLFDDIAVKRALTRLSYEIIERSPDIENTVLIGIKTRGVPLGKSI